MLPDCDQAAGICQAAGAQTVGTPVESSTKDDGLPLICKDGGKCYYSTCKRAGSCQGITCPKDGKVCGLSKCCTSGKCEHATYWADKTAGKPSWWHGQESPPSSAASSVSFVTGERDEDYGSATNVVKPKPVVPAQPCHSGLTHLCTLANESTIYLGTERAFELSPKRFDLYISLLGKPGFNGDRMDKQVVTGNALARANMPAGLFTPPAMSLYIDWPDYGVPDLHAGFWDELVTYLQSTKLRVGIFCMGGHGRTGSAAAILLAKFGLLEEGECPVTVVRDLHCQEAVESLEQITYIETETKRKVVAEPNEKQFYAGYGGNYTQGTLWKDNPNNPANQPKPNVTVTTVGPATIKGPEPTKALSKKAAKRLKRRLLREQQQRAKREAQEPPM